MNRRQLRRIVGWVAGGVAVVAVLLGVLLAYIRQELILQVNSLDDYVTFALGQVEVDVLRLVTVAQQYAASAPDVTIDDVRERTDVLFSRTDVISKGEIRRAVEDLPEYGDALQGLQAYIASMDAVLEDDPPEPAAVAAVVAPGMALQNDAHRLILAANQKLTVQRSAVRQGALQLVHYLALGYLCLVAVVVVGALGVYRLFRGTEARRLFEITDSIPGAVFQFRQAADGSAEYVFTNRQFSQIRGFDPMQAATGADAGFVGDNLLALVIDEDRQALRLGLMGLEAGRRPVDMEFRIDHPQTGRRWLNLRASGRDDDGVVISGVFFDITERRAQENAVAEANAKARELSEQLVDLTDAIPGAVFQMMVSPDGKRRFSFVSRKAAELHGRSLESLMQIEGPIGHGLTNSIDEHRGVAADAFLASLQSLQPVDFDVLVEHASRRMWLKTMATVRRMPDGGALFSGVWLDVSDMKAQAVALEEAKQQAEDAAQAKSSFLAMMSHEIRTPMNGVMSMAEMLDQTELSDDQRGMTGVIRQSSAALLTIINDILDFSKIEAGKLEIESIPFSLAEVVEGAGDLLGTRAEEYGINLTIDIEPTLTDHVMGDPTRLRQMLLNLSGNAIKFTEKGSVTIRVCAVGAGDTHYVRFEVIDTGIGLTDEQQAKLFQAFHQADTSTSRKYGGTGLGLSICRKLCELMGGSIGAFSTFGQGSTFWFELPLPAAAEPLPLALADITGACVLAIGMTPARVVVLSRYLQFGGAVLECVDTLSDALARLHAGADSDAGPGIDVVLLDGGTPDLRGLELARALLADVPDFTGKVVLVAPRGLASTMAAAGDVGIFATVTYPIRRQRLALVIAAALGRADLADRGITAADAGYEPPDIETARAAGCLILVAEDNPTNQVVIRKILSRMGFAHEIAENGRIALEMYRSGAYGLVLADFHMPEMDGLQLAAAIRADEAQAGLGLDGAGPHVPIVALTADALSGTAALCERAGMDGYLTKPIDTRALAASLHSHLPQAAALRRVALGASDGPAVAQNGPALPMIDESILDLARLAESFGALDGEAIGFVHEFVAAAESMVERTIAALQAGDGGQARHEAHALKGAARSTGAVRLGQLAADIQDLIDADDIATANYFVEPLRETWVELRDESVKLPHM
jgi:signal transduction histidine kinase/CheY-like chemotaxis protein/HPt (histidine-containing phosphotransfer) domain-containing protein